MYRNTLLRYSPTEPLPPVYPGHGTIGHGHSQMSPGSVRNGGQHMGTSPYHTMRPHMQQQQYIQVKMIENISS